MFEQLRYRVWKKLLVWKAQALCYKGNAKMGLPLLAFIELNLDRHFEQGGYHSAREAARVWLDNFSYVPVDQHDHPVPRDLITLPTLSDLKLRPNMVNTSYSAPWYEINGVLYASISALENNSEEVWTTWPLWSPSPTRIRDVKILRVPEEEKSINRSIGFYWRKE